MASDNGSDRLAQLLVPYCRRNREEPDGPDHEIGWWFAGAPPCVVREALAVVQAVPGLRLDDQPPAEWLVDQAAARNGALAGFAGPARPVSPRLRIDSIIVPCSEALGLAREIAKLWPIDGGRSALDVAVVQGFPRLDASDYSWRWTVGGKRLISVLTDIGCLDASYCGFRWDWPWPKRMTSKVHLAQRAARRQRAGCGCG
jgi:hypothetical protein